MFNFKHFHFFLQIYDLSLHVFIEIVVFAFIDFLDHRIYHGFVRKLIFMP